MVVYWDLVELSTNNNGDNGDIGKISSRPHCDRTLGSWLGFGESSPNGRKIQVSELLYFTQIYGWENIWLIYALER